MNTCEYVGIQCAIRIMAVFSCLTLQGFSFAQPPRGLDCEASDLLPQSIVAYAELSNLGNSLETILKHPLRAKLESMPAYASFMQSDAPKPLQVGIKAFEANMKLSWQQAIAIVGDRGVAVALDAAEGAVAVLMHSTDEEMLERFRGFVLVAKMLQGGMAKQGDYRGFKADLLNDNIRMVRLHDWLLFTNKSELGKSIIDRYLDRNKETIAHNEKYASAMKAVTTKDAKRLMTAYVDIEKFRTAGVPKNLYNERIDNFAVELIAGGVLANLRHTDHATATLDLERNGLSMQVATPHQRDWEPPREYFFGAPMLAVAPGGLKVNDRLFAISAHRDISQMWMRCGDLLTDKANDQLAVADTQLTTFFAGRDFGEDILGALESDVQIVGKVPDFTNVLPQPTIKLPAFAMEFRMKNPEETQPELRRVFQAFVGFLTITGAMNGQPQLDLGMEKEGNAQLVTATFVPKHDQRESREAPIQFNFSPTLAFSGHRVILSSSTLLARELLGVDSAGQTEEANAAQANTCVHLDATNLQKILLLNKPQLVANNMLEKGHSKEAAEAEIGLLLALIAFIRDASVSLGVDATQLSLTANIDVDCREGLEDE